MSGTEVPLNVGAVIKNVRRSLDLSLDKAALLTGVSKAMLAQIERGESSPTVSTLWKISSGLRITFSKLLSGQNEEYSVSKLKDIKPIYEDEGRMVLYNIFPFDPVTGFDYFYIELKPDCCYESPGHPNVFEECIVVTQGALTMVIDEQDFVLDQGASINFKGEAKHKYTNKSDKIVIFQNIMKY